jgi:tetratricopeptide (TPR) repeat protein
MPYEVRNEISGHVAGQVIQAGDISLALPPKTPLAIAGLPPQSLFVGRDAELACLSSLLGPGQKNRAVMVSAVAGLAGVGKTALAVHAAHQAVRAGWFPGGVLMVNMRGYDPLPQRVTAISALTSLLGSLGISREQIPPDQPGLERLWRSVLADRPRMLIVVDNASHTDQVRPLLPAAEEHQVLVTSRHSLADLHGARLLDLDVLTSSQAVELLTRELIAANPADTRLQDNLDAVKEIGRLCGHLPLAIGIAAALLAADPDQAIADMATVLSSECQRLLELDYDGNLAVRAAFDLSYNDLPDQHARIFRLMGLNPGTEISTEGIAATAGHDVATTRRIMRQLHRAHLVASSPAGRGRWQMHDLLRLYSVDKAAHDPERAAGIERLLTHYLATTQAASRLLSPRAPQEQPEAFASNIEALDWLAIEHSNIVASVTLAQANGHHRLAIDLGGAMGSFFELRNHSHDWLTVNRSAIASARALNARNAEAMLLTGLGVASQRLHRWEESVHFLQQALEIHRDLGNHYDEGRGLDNLGQVYQNMGRWRESIDHHCQAIGICRKFNDRYGLAMLANNLGMVYQTAGRWQGAVDCYNYAIEVFREFDDSYNSGKVLNNIGRAYCSLGRWQESLDCHRRALEIFQELGDGHNEGSALNYVGIIYEELGCWSDAIDCHGRALVKFQEIGDRLGEAEAVNNLGIAYRSLGCYQESLDHHRRALGIFQHLSSPGGEREALVNLGIAYHDMENLDGARDCYERALEMARSSGQLHGEGEVLNNLGILYCELERWEDAILCHQRDIEICKNFNDYNGQGMALRNLGVIYHELQQTEDARKCWRQALELLAPFPGEAARSRTYWLRRQLGDTSIEA